MSEKSSLSMEKGTQPLDQILTDLDLKNNDLVKSATEQLTHRMVAKGRKGRRLTRNVQGKILRALNTCQVKKQYILQDLFNY